MICVILVAGHGTLLETEIKVDLSKHKTRSCSSVSSYSHSYSVTVWERSFLNFTGGGAGANPKIACTQNPPPPSTTAHYVFAPPPCVA